MRTRYCRWLLGLALAGWFGTLPARGGEPRIGERLERRGDEIVVCGQLYHTTTPVVLWMDPGGYDAYRVERRFSPLDEADWNASKSKSLRTPNRFGLRKEAQLSAEQLEQVRGGGWDLPLLQTVVDQFVIHFDVAGSSPVIVDMPTLWTHSITNTGDGDLTTLFWTNELFNPEDADTYREDV